MIDVSSFAYVGEGALVVDDERRCLAANGPALALLDLAHGEDVIGRRIEDVAPLPEGVDVDEAWTAFRRVGVYAGIVFCPRSDGAPRFLACRARARVEEHSHLIVVRDVTAEVERETAERQALERTATERARLHAIVRDLPIAIVVFEVTDFRIDVANGAYLAMVGRDDVVGLTLDQVVPDVSPQSIYAYLSEVRREKQPRERREHPLLMPGPGGASFHYFTNKFQPLFDEEGEVKQVLVTVLDVTHEARARRLVAESAEQLRRILDEMPVGVNVRDAISGEVLINNRASTEILGREVHKDPATLSVYNARYPDGQRLGPDDHAFRRAMLTHEPVRNQIVLLDRAGTVGGEVVVRSSAALVDGPDATRLVVSVIEDITAEYRLLAEHEQTARFAETFVGILAHDLRTPLSAITIGAALLADRLRESPPEAKLVERVASSARRMAEMVTQLLDLTQSRLAGGVAVERARVDLVVVLNTVLDEVAIAKPGVTLRRLLPGRLDGEWDGARLAQVVSNLVGNAVQHGDRSRPITVALQERESAVLLSVHSHGPAIPGNVLPDMFDPFRRRSGMPRSKTAGLGLGLYIVREIVRAHGGSICVTSADTDGTTFEISLPRFAESQAHQPSEPSVRERIVYER